VTEAWDIITNEGIWGQHLKLSLKIASNVNELQVLTPRID